MDRRLRIALLILVVLQAFSWPLAMLTADTSGVRSLQFAIGCHAALAAGTIAAVLRTLRGMPLGRLTAPAAALGVAGLLAGGLVTSAGFGTAYSHPTLAVSIGLGLLLCLESPWGARLAIIASLGTAYLVGIHATLALGPVALTSAASNLAMLTAVPLLGSWLATALADSSRSSTAFALSTEQVRRGEARETERSKQYQLLHDTVLSTLSALSRGSLDPKDPAVAQRLTGDADYLRGLIATSASGAGMYLVGELARITREQAASGLRVHQQISDVPDELPLEVRRALADSMYEALTNVVKHSGRKEAWVTIVGTEEPSPGGVLVTVTDQGAGFDPAMPRTGLGIDRSLRQRMHAVGGEAVVDSEPGQGTSVELRWPS